MNKRKKLLILCLAVFAAIGLFAADSKSVEVEFKLDPESIGADDKFFEIYLADAAVPNDATMATLPGEEGGSIKDLNKGKVSLELDKNDMKAKLSATTPLYMWVKSFGYSGLSITMRCGAALSNASNSIVQYIPWSASVTENEETKTAKSTQDKSTNGTAGVVELSGLNGAATLKSWPISIETDPIKADTQGTYKGTLTLSITGN